MNAQQYLNTQLGKTIEAIKQDYIAGKRVFFIVSSDIQLLKKIITSGSILPYIQTVKNISETNVHTEGLKCISHDINNSSMNFTIPQWFVYITERDKEGKILIDWENLNVFTKHISNYYSMTMEENNFANRKRMIANSIVINLCDVAPNLQTPVAQYAAIIRVPPIGEDEFISIFADYAKEFGDTDNVSNRTIAKDIYHAMTGATLRQIDYSLRKCKEVVGRIYVDDDKSKDSIRIRNTIIERIRSFSNDTLEGVSALSFMDDSRSQEPSGMVNLTKWISNRSIYMSKSEKRTEHAQKSPGGLLLSGVPGSGKSMIARYLAKEFGLNGRLIRFDIGNVHGKYVGDSEKNMDEVLARIESLSPCIVFIDEIEKAFSGTSNGHETTIRVFGKLLTWLQEKANRNLSCFVYATSNNVSILPPELLRSGRFDAKFYSFMPSASECADIFINELSEQNKRYGESHSDNSERLSLFNTTMLNIDFFKKEILNSKTCIKQSITGDSTEVVRGNKFFTGADIVQLIDAAKIIYMTNLKGEEQKKADAVYQSDLFIVALKEAVEEVRTYGETNIYDLALNMVKLAKDAFLPVSKNILLPLEGVDMGALFDNDNSKSIYNYEGEQEHLKQFTENYDKQLYINVRNAINSTSSHIKRMINKADYRS